MIWKSIFSFLLFQDCKFSNFVAQLLLISAARHGQNNYCSIFFNAFLNFIVPPILQIMKENQILIYDTTLRDGSQAEGVSFTVAAKLRVAEKLDQFGVDYIEGGWPGATLVIWLFSRRRKISIYAMLKWRRSALREEPPFELKKTLK